MLSDISSNLPSMISFPSREQPSVCAGFEEIIRLKCSHTSIHKVKRHMRSMETLWFAGMFGCVRYAAKISERRREEMTDAFRVAKNKDSMWPC